MRQCIQNEMIFYLGTMNWYDLIHTPKTQISLGMDPHE